MADVVPPGTTMHKEDPKPTKEERVDFFNLPCPIPYEEIHREAFMSLKPDLFEGLRFDLTRGLNPKFALSHSLLKPLKSLLLSMSLVLTLWTQRWETNC